MRKWFKKSLGIILAGTMAFTILTGCGGSSDSGSTTAAKSETKEATNGGETVIGVTSFADTLEPTEQYFSWVVSRYGVGETLTKFNENGEITPCLAESWEVSDDNLSWTFKIREGVKFSNGDDMTPELVKGSLERTFEIGRAHV